MEVRCTHASVGVLHCGDRQSPDCRLVNVTITGAYVVLKLEKNELGPDLPVLIKKEDIGKIEACLAAPSPFLAFTLTKKGCGKLLKVARGKYQARGVSLDKVYHVDSQKQSMRRIFIFTNSVSAELQRCLQESYEAQLVMMTMDKSTQLLRRCYYHSSINYVGDLHEIEVEVAKKRVSPLTTSRHSWSKAEVSEIKKITSYIYYFKVLKGTRKSLQDKMTDMRSGSSKYGEFLAEIHWLHNMFTDQIQDYGKKLRCGSQTCQKWTAVQKCASCEERRYCAVACQEKDANDGHLKICQELKKRREQKKVDMDKQVMEVYVNPEGMTYSRFMDLLEKRGNHLVRRALKSGLGSGQGITDEIVSLFKFA